MAETQGREQLLVLVKALPRPGDRSAESAFAAGVTAERAWRRQAPLPETERPVRFAPWQWIAYDWRDPDGAGDAVRRVMAGTVEPGIIMPEAERAQFLEPLFVGSPMEAAERGEGLALVRPGDPLLTWRKKRGERLEAERHAYAIAQFRLAFLSGRRAPVEPCAYEFRLAYDLDDGRREDPVCDHELVSRFAHLAARHGERRALELLDETVNLDYAEAGMACVLAADDAGRWHLGAVLRLDETAQMALL